VPGVDLQDPLPAHVRLLAGVREGLRLHDLLHVGAPAILGGDHHARSVVQPVADLHGVHVLTVKGLLPPVSQHLEGLLEILELGVLAQFQALLGHILELLVLVVHQVLHQVLVNRVSEEDNLQNSFTVQHYFIDIHDVDCLNWKCMEIDP
jgi:hypothetical protein